MYICMIRFIESAHMFIIRMKIYRERWFGRSTCIVLWFMEVVRSTEDAGYLSVDDTKLYRNSIESSKICLYIF